MEWREELDDAKAAKNLDALETLQQTVRAARQTEIAGTGELLDAGNYDAAALNVRKLMFLEKFTAEIGDVFTLIEA